MTLKSNTVKTLRLVAFVEGLSYLGLLFIAMPLKYWGGMPEAVKLTGTAHGYLYIAYMVLVIVAFALRAISGDRMGWSIIAGLIPFGTFVNDRYLKRAELAA